MATPSAMPVTHGITSPRSKRKIRAPAPTAIWALITRNGRCGFPSKHGIGHLSNASDPNHGGYPGCQTCHMNGGNHEVRTCWGFLGLRIPTKKNVLALIDVSPSLKDPLTKLCVVLPEGQLHRSWMTDPQWVFDRGIILQAAGILDASLATDRTLCPCCAAAEVPGVRCFNGNATPDDI